MFDRADDTRDRFVPIFSIHESPLAYLIEAEIPGASTADVLVEAQGSDVVVRCARVVAGPDEGAFTRKLRLSHAIDGARLAAEVRDGVLRVRAPKLNAADEG